MRGLKQQVHSVLQRIETAAKRSGRDPHEITLVAVSKQQSAEKMDEVGEILHSEGRPVLFGENYLQEYQEKARDLHIPHTPHYIGAIQSKKLPEIVQAFSVIQTVGSTKHLLLLGETCRKLGLHREIFLQVNISHDQQKQGMKKEELYSLLQSEESLLFGGILAFRGLMAITQWYDVAEDARFDFQKMRELGQNVCTDPKLRRCFQGGQLYLSMGMSRDFEIAIECGASFIRVGSDIFGNRE